MRAVRYAGGKVEAVELPGWVELHVSTVSKSYGAGVHGPAAAWSASAVECHRCRKVVALVGAQPDAERELGRFALWHRRCQEPAEVRRAAAVGAAPSEEWMRAFERKCEGSEDDGT